MDSTVRRVFVSCPTNALRSSVLNNVVTQAQERLWTSGCLPFCRFYCWSVVRCHTYCPRLGPPLAGKYSTVSACINTTITPIGVASDTRILRICRKSHRVMGIPGYWCYAHSRRVGQKGSGRVEKQSRREDQQRFKEEVESEGCFCCQHRLIH